MVCRAVCAAKPEVSMTVPASDTADVTLNTGALYKRALFVYNINNNYCGGALCQRY